MIFDSMSLPHESKSSGGQLFVRNDDKNGTEKLLFEFCGSYFKSEFCCDRWNNLKLEHYISYLNIINK